MDAPPLLARAAYRLVGWQPGAAHRDWVLHDVRSGRATRWSILPPVVFLVVPALAFQWALARRAGTGASWAAGPAAALIVGLLLGSWVVRRPGRRDRLVARQLRAQGMLPDGSPDPTPTWDARLSNEDRLAFVAFTVAVMTLLVGVLPIVTRPEPVRRCLEPSAEERDRLASAATPGVGLRGVRAWNDGSVTMIAAVLDGPVGGTGTWVRVGERLLPLDRSAAEVTPAEGIAAVRDGDGERFQRAAAAARRCAEASAG